MDYRLAPSRPYLSPDDLMEIATAFQKSRVLLTAFELDLFSALGNKRLDSAEVARMIGADAHATERLMNALCAMKLLHKDEGLFSVSTPAQKFLVKGQPGYMAGLAHTANLWNTWGTLTDAVRAGTAVEKASVAEHTDAWREAFIAAMHYRAMWHAPSVVSLLDTSEVKRLLDLGGGSGAYSMAFTRVREQISAFVFDLPQVIPLTKKYLREEGFEGKIETTAGDYLTDELGSDYDLIFLSAVIHSNAPEENKALIKKCAKSLAHGGQIIIQDFIMNEDRTSPAFGAFFALNMLVATPHGDTYTAADVRAWMKEAHITFAERKDTEIGTTLLIGRKLSMEKQ